MPSNSIKTSLRLAHYYHIYNRGNNEERLFLRPEHYLYFMEKYMEIIHPSVSTFAFCLIPNHFHFLLRIDSLDPKSTIKEPSHMFRRFFQQYSVWFNTKERRRGSLFTKYFRRIEIDSEDYLRRLVCYIHWNPVKHGISKDFRNYQYSSYQFFTNLNKTFIARDEVISWFNHDLSEFFIYHNLDGEISDLGPLGFDEH